MTSRPLLLPLAFAGLVASTAYAASIRPNIVVLMADDMGYGDLSSYGSLSIETPAIDSLAADGVRFTHFYVNAPECTPSRAAFLTGRYQQRVGGLECAIGVGNVGRYDEAQWLRGRNELGLPQDEPTLASLLKSSGYATGIFGKWHLGYGAEFGPKAHGFDESFITLGGSMDYIAHVEPDGNSVLRHNDQPIHVDGYITDVFADKAIEWLNHQTEPYFLFVPFTAPHDPFQAPDDGPVKKDWNQGKPETYRKMVERLDRRIGDILAAIARRPDADNTIVIFFSDNGAPNLLGSNGRLRGWKGQMWEGGIRVPCIVRWPRQLPAGHTTDQVSAAFDLTASLLSAAGATEQAGHPLDGSVLWNVWRGDRPDFNRTLFFRYKRLENRRWAVLEGAEKFVIDDGETWLIDLNSDPREKINLAPTRPERVAHFKQLIADWEKNVIAPRLRDFRADEIPAQVRRSQE